MNKSGGGKMESLKTLFVLSLIYVCRCMFMCAHACGGQSLTLGVFFYHFLPLKNLHVFICVCGGGVHACAHAHGCVFVEVKK